jgi:hypothetical protein
MIKEDFLHYIWQHKLFIGHNLKTTNGEELEVIDTGTRNDDAGPDFFNAKIKMGDKIWAGNVEIHLQSSDWNLHKHTNNDDYQSVILHVVQQANTDIKRKTGENIPQLELKYPDQMVENYHNLFTRRETIRCSKHINEVSSIFISSWMNTLLSERLLKKTEHITSLLEKNNHNWEESFYTILARNFGFGTNSEPFERLAQSIPLICLQKHKNNLLQIEAMMLGQAGLLPEEDTDEYVKKLRKEYTFLKKKFNLISLQQPGWKLMRVRPGSFPHVRIAQFAALVNQSSKLFSKVIENPDYEYICSLFSTKTSDYWETHYHFKEESMPRSKKLGKKTIDILLINTIIPFIFYYGKRNENESLQENALKLLEQIPKEENKITSEWENLGIKIENAFDSQAVIQLKNNYCEKKDCLRCRIGHKVLTKK